MSELEVPARIAALRSTFHTIEVVLDPEALAKEIARLSELASEPDLWGDTERAQSITSALSHRQSELSRIVDVRSRLDDLDVLIDMANEENDEASAAEVRQELDQLETLLGAMEIQTLLDGEFDASPAIITIRAGAGGVDAADFAEMLLRMYTRWAEAHQYSVAVLDTSYAEEAGITSKNVEAEAKSTKNPDVARLLGADGEYGKDLKVKKDWVVQIVKQVGNYGEVFAKNIGEETPIGLARGLNAQWTDGGLMYSPPFR